MLSYTTNADRVARDLQAIARGFPREFRQAFATLSRGLKTRTAEVVRTGRSAKLGVDLAFAPLDPITVKLRGRRTFGGVLARSIKSYIDVNGITLQWPYGLRKYGTALQTKERRPLKDGERQYLEIWARDLAGSVAPVPKPKRGMSGADYVFAVRAEKSAILGKTISDGYSRPARAVWAPIVAARGFRRYCLDVVRKRIAAIIEKRAKRR